MRWTSPRTGSAKTRGPAWPIFRRAAGPFVIGFWGTGNSGDRERTARPPRGHLTPPNPEHRRSVTEEVTLHPETLRTRWLPGAHCCRQFGVAALRAGKPGPSLSLHGKALGSKVASTRRLRVKLFC